MDIQRNQSSRFRQFKKYQWPAIGIALLVTISTALNAFAPNAPTVALADLWIGTVQKGDFSREVRGPGTLVTNHLRWLTARTQGRVEHIHILPGSQVQRDTLILELSNPDLAENASSAKLAMIAARAEHKARLAQLNEALLTQEVRLLETKTNLEQAKLRYEAELLLAQDNIISSLDLNQSRLDVEQFEARLVLEQKRFQAMPALHAAQTEASAARLEQMVNAYELLQSAMASLSVFAGIDGVLQEIPLEQGQQVNAGSLLARVADPSDLKAELRIPEIQAKDVRLRQPVLVDTRFGKVQGEVARIDPAVLNGTVTVDVRFIEALPASARIDQSVDGEIVLQRLQDVLFVERPNQVQSYSNVSLFKVDTAINTASRIQVTTGGGSLRYLQIERGLQEGEQIILSDISRWQDLQALELQ